MSFNEDPEDGKKVFKLNFDFPSLSDTAMFSYLKFSILRSGLASKR